MTFGKHIHTLEWILLGSLVFVYLLYIVRMGYLGWRLKTSFHPIFIKLVLRSAYFILFVIALLAPSFGDLKKEVKIAGKDVLIAIDLSNSMNAEDVAPSRLTFAKHEILDLLPSMQGDRMGLMIFTSEAFLQCPFTYDLEAIKLYINSISTKMIEGNGTDLGTALQKGFDTFEETQSPANRGKAMILITDGENFGEATTQIAGQLKKHNIHLMVLGVGSDKNTKIPSGKSFLYENGQAVITKLERKKLTQLSAVAGGSYYELSNTRNDVAKLAQDIQLIETNSFSAHTVDAKANKYIYFLGFALLLMVIDVLFTVKTLSIE